MKLWYILFIVVFQVMSSNQVSKLCKKELRHKGCLQLPADQLCGRSRPTPRIVGGSAARPGDFPWAAFLHSQGLAGSKFEKQVFVCGATVISQMYVVSAAHCFAKDLFNAVRVGDYDVSSAEDCFGDECSPPPQDLEIESVVFPPDSDKVKKADIALVRLKKKMAFNKYVSPICLPTTNEFKNENFLKNKTLTVVGWGSDIIESIGLKFNQDKLQVLRVPFIPRHECIQSVGGEYESLIESLGEKTMCAGGLRHQDSCNGDSGGPLSGQFMVQGPLRSFLVGVVSFGKSNCYQDGFPGFYTNVTKYTDWILDNLHD